MTGGGVTGLGRPLVSSVLAGAATGCRSSAGLAALVLATRPGARHQPDRALDRPWVKAIAGLLAAGEIAADKLPQVPSRLDPPGLASRVGGAAAAGALIARRASLGAGAPANADGAEAAGSAGAVEPEVGAGPADDGGQGGRATIGAGRPAVVLTAACVVAGAGTAVATSWLGARWRGWAAGRLGQDWIGAVLEDAAAVSLAAGATL